MATLLFMYWVCLISFSFNGKYCTQTSDLSLEEYYTPMEKGTTFRLLLNGRPLRSISRCRTGFEIASENNAVFLRTLKFLLLANFGPKDFPPDSLHFLQRRFTLVIYAGYPIGVSCTWRFPRFTV